MAGLSFVGQRRLARRLSDVIGEPDRHGRRIPQRFHGMGVFVALAVDIAILLCQSMQIFAFLHSKIEIECAHIQILCGSERRRCDPGLVRPCEQARSGKISQQTADSFSSLP